MTTEMKTVAGEEVVTAIHREVTNGVLNRNCIQKEDLDLDLYTIFYHREFEEFKFLTDCKTIGLNKLNPDVFNLRLYTTGNNCEPYIALGDVIWDGDNNEYVKGFILSFNSNDSYFEPSYKILAPDMTLGEVIEIVKKTLRGKQIDKISVFSCEVKQAIKEDKYEIEVDGWFADIIDAFIKDELDMSVWDYFDEVVIGENHLTDIELVRDKMWNTFFKFNINE